MSALPARTLADLLEEIEALVGVRQGRVICLVDDEPVPDGLTEHDLVIRTVALDPDPTLNEPVQRVEQRTADPWLD